MWRLSYLLYNTHGDGLTSNTSLKPLFPFIRVSWNFLTIETARKALRCELFLYAHQRLFYTRESLILQSGHSIIEPVMLLCLSLRGIPRWNSCLCQLICEPPSSSGIWLIWLFKRRRTIYYVCSPSFIVLLLLQCLIAWFYHTERRKEKRYLYEQAMTKYKKKLVREGVRQWITVADCISQTREKLACDRHAKVTSFASMVWLIKPLPITSAGVLFTHWLMPHCFLITKFLEFLQASASLSLFYLL